MARVCFKITWGRVGNGRNLDVTRLTMCYNKAKYLGYVRSCVYFCHLKRCKIDKCKNELKAQVAFTRAFLY